jgi:MFS family permease
LALPAGALADIFDKRKFLIVVEVLTTVVSAIYAVIVGVGWATPGNLLLFTFLVGAAGALTVPAWQSVVPQLVSKDDLPSAIAANSVGVNISRALGPALCPQFPGLKVRHRQRNRIAHRIEDRASVPNRHQRLSVLF